LIRFRALGGLTVSDGDAELSIGGPRQRRLLAVLLIHRNSVVSVDRLADVVFAGEPTDAASTTMRSYVARIRRVIDSPGSASMVVTRAPGYLLEVPPEAFDVACFERIVAEASSLLGRGDATQTSSLLREALGLWRGGAYAEFADEDWARPEAQRLEELQLVAQERLVEAELACGRTAEVIPQIEALVADQPLREGFRAQHMLALYRAGRQADAVRVFSDYRRVLGEELGLEPTPALAELEGRLLAHDPTLQLTESEGHPLRGYRLGERLGTGRDGTVHAARLPGVERDLAIRIFREEIADDPEFVRSFEAHAHQVASLRHPAVVPVHDYWREPGAAYLVMRRMHGGTLADRLARGPLSAGAAAALVLRVGGALVAAADVGLVHGRLAPESVFFDVAGDPYLADFSLRPDHPARTASDDVHDLAVMVRECLDVHDGSVADVLARGVATVGRPPMAELVPQLAAALTGAHLPATRPNPFKGLRAFDEADAADFFGRAGVVDELLDRLRRNDLLGRLVLVVGGSGTGKSSVVRAGVLPRVRRGDVVGSERWFVTTMLPGSAPFKELAESLRRVAVVEAGGLVDELAADELGIDRVIRRVVPDGGQLLLVIDQFEELFTLAGEPDQRTFLAGLTRAVSAADSRLRVIATLRADFYDRPLLVQPFGSVVNDATVTIAAMLPADLEAAVVEPALRVGGRVERALVAELVSAVVDAPAALPSLQYTLYEIAERSPDMQLSLAAYRQLGGVEGAIASRAELLYSSLDPGQHAAARRLFERLVVVGTEGEPTRRRASRTELSGIAPDPIIDALIDRWAEARLLTLDRHPDTRVPTVEIAHEALLRKWPRVAAWLAEDRDAIVTLGHLRDAAASWVELDRDPGALYRGVRLEVVLDVADGPAMDVSGPEGEFLDASRDERDRERREETERVARQGRANRRLRVQLAAIAVALVVALAGGFVAIDQRREARQERRTATARELAAAAAADLTTDPERSILLALAAIDATRSSGGTVLPEAVAALHRAVTESRVVMNVPGIGGSLDWSPDGRFFVTEGPEESGLVDIRDAATGKSVRSFKGHDDDVNQVAFSNDSSMLATTGDDGAVRIWKVGTGAELLEVRSGPVRDNPVRGASFSGDGDRLTAAWPDAVRIIDVASEEVIATIAADNASGTAFSPDGERVAIGTFGDGTTTVIDAASGAELLAIAGRSEAFDLEWSPDGRSLAIARAEGTAEIFDAASGELELTISGHTALVWGVDWSPDGSRLATVSDDGTALVSEIADGGARELFSFSAQDTANGLIGVAFSPDGEQLMTGDLGITAVKVWDLSRSGGAEWANIEGFARFTSDGRSLLVRGAKGRINVLDLATGEVRAARGLRRLELGDEWFDTSPDGELLVSFGPDGLEAWDASTGADRFTIPIDEVAGINGMAWGSGRGRLAVSFDTSRSGKVVVYDRAGHELATRHEAADQIINSLSFSPDGRFLATTRSGLRTVDPTNMPVTIWDWANDKVVRTIDTSAALVRYDPMGDRIATSRLVEGTAEIWDVRTGRRLVTLSVAAAIRDLAFSPDGSTVATGHTDGTIRLWDAGTGRQQLLLQDHEGEVDGVWFSPDGSKLATLGGEGLVRVWALELHDLIAIAEKRLTRGFTAAECRQYLHVERCGDA
jgi:WD40 repeat protein/DNA-binding SARP family transcriptional activator